MNLPTKVRLECDNCGASMVVTYDAKNPVTLLEINCYCGHDTIVQQVPRTPTGKAPSHHEYDAKGKCKWCPAEKGQ
jgi:ribosomal protein L33